MRYNVMEYAVEGTTAPWGGTLVLLHGSSSDHTQLLPLGRRLGPRLRLFAPKSARWVAFGLARRYYSWFTLQAPPCPEPISFGDALFQLEQFLWEVVQGDASMCSPVREKVDLIGYEQGAVLALTLAALWPELFRAVVSIGGFWPHVPGALGEGAPMRGLPVLLLEDASRVSRLARTIEADKDELRRRGARVEVDILPAVPDPRDPDLALRVSAWLEAQEREVEVELS
jgi:predicted esterase